MSCCAPAAGSRAPRRGCGPSSGNTPPCHAPTCCVSSTCTAAGGASCSCCAPATPRPWVPSCARGVQPRSPEARGPQGPSLTMVMVRGIRSIAWGHQRPLPMGGDRQRSSPGSTGEPRARLTAWGVRGTRLIEGEMS